MAGWAPCYDWLKWILLVCAVRYELSPANGWAGGLVMDKEKASDWIRQLATNVETLCFVVVGVSVDYLRGVEWLNGVGRGARDVCVIVDMQKVEVVKEIRKLIEDLKCLGLQVDVGRSGWATCDTPVSVDDRYVAASGCGAGGLHIGGMVGRPPASLVASSLWSMAEELGIGLDNDKSSSHSDVDMALSPLGAATRRQLGVSEGGVAGPGEVS